MNLEINFLIKDKFRK